MRKNIRQRLSLSLFFSLAVFIIFVITAMIIAFISFFVINSGLVQRSGPSGLFTLVLTLMVASVIVGTVVSFILGRVPLKPIRKVVSATNRLAAGDFSARLDISRPPELRELAESFNRMAQELGGLEMLRADFVNSFSHEFKTPIVSIKGFAEMLQYDDLTSAEKAEYLGIIISESDRLASLATNVLNLSKVENQAILSDVRAFNLTEQIRRCILLLETKWEEKGISLSVDIDEVTYAGNEELLNQVWLNLLDNAIKFTQRGDGIAVSLKPCSDELRFAIRDDGCGIGEEALAHIFDKFYQADASRANAGNGLGLTLAKKIVELHRGSIACRSVLDHGSEFVVSLPL